MKVLIWGTGENARKYLKEKEVGAKDIIGFIESNPKSSEFQCEWGGYKVYAPVDIKKMEYDFILVCVWNEKNVNEIASTCVYLDIMDSRIVFMRNIRGRTLSVDDYIYYNEYQDNKKIKEVFPIFGNKFIEPINADTKVFSARTNEDILNNSLLQTPDFHDYTSDYFRYRTFEFVAEQIKNRGIEGDVAEVGVARGTFSKLINAVFHDRNLYMFDTFDSFDRQEWENDISTASKNEGFYNLYKGINVEDVIKIMPHKKKCIVKKGLFPNTTAGLENNTYAFVSIDVDLEKSIYNALDYFYPRLNQGGFIFVHDYRCWDLEGVKRAVQRYEKEHGRFYKVPIADRGGTLIIMK